MKKVYKKLKKHIILFEKPCEFTGELIDGLFKDLEHIIVEHPYVEPTVQDAETIENEAKKEMTNF